MPAAMQTAGSRPATEPPCSLRSAASRSTNRSISGHLPNRTFCAISKNVMGLSRTVSAASIAARAGFDRRWSPPSSRPRRGYRAGPPLPAAFPQVEVALLHRPEKVGAGAKLALEQADLERATGDRDQPDDQLAALGDDDLLAAERRLNELGQVGLGGVNGDLLHPAPPAERAKPSQPATASQVS